MLLPDVRGVADSRIVYVPLAALLLAAGLAACGSGQKTYIYNFAGKDASSAGIYLTIVSPVKLPPSAFKSGKLVAHVSGVEDCAFTQKINNPPRKYAALLGTKLTIKVYGPPRRRSSFARSSGNLGRRRSFTRRTDPLMQKHHPSPETTKSGLRVGEGRALEKSSGGDDSGTRVRLSG